MDHAKLNIVDDFPAERLPDELRGQIDPAERVTVSVSVRSIATPSFRSLFAALHESRVASDDPVMRVRALREEWKDRERSLETIPRGGTD